MNASRKNEIFETFWVKNWKIIAISLLIGFLIFNTIYSFDNGLWIWEDKITWWQKVIGISVSLSAILGVLSVILFALHKYVAYVLGIINAALFALFAFSFGLAIEGFINLFIYIPIMLLMSYKTTRIKTNKSNFESFRSNVYSTIFFVFLTIVLTIVFYFTNPELNKVAIKVFGADKVYPYGGIFRYYVAASLLNSLINALSIVALTMMVLGFRDSWIVWIIKNIFSFMFFGGIGFVNITTLLINIIYMLISLYLYLFTTNKTKLRIVFSNKINFNEISNMLKDKHFTFSGNQLLSTKDFNYKEVKKNLKDALTSIKYNQVNDNVVFNHYLLDLILSLDEYNEKTLWAKIQISALKFRFKMSLALQDKASYIFVFYNSRNYQKYNKYKFCKRFAKNIVFLDNDLYSSLFKVKTIIESEQDKKAITNWQKIINKIW